MDRNYEFEDLRGIIARLRSENGCPWDREQTHESLIPCMVNETAEAVAAIEVYRRTSDSENLCEELGDMLLQVLLQSQIAEEEGLFDILDVIRVLSEKMIRRHPHVFADGSAGTSEEVLISWEEIKRRERLNRKDQTEKIKEDALTKSKCEIVKILSEKKS